MIGRTVMDIGAQTHRSVKLSLMTWAELIPRLRSAGFVEERIGKGSQRKLIHPITEKEVWVSIHTKKDVGRLARRILKDAGLE